MSLTSNLYTAYSGMQVSQTGLTVTTNNLMNVDTAGYSRQLLQTSSVMVCDPYEIYHTGNGVKVQSIQQASNQFTRNNLRDNLTALGYSDVQSQLYGQVELVFGDVQGYNMVTAVDDFFGAWQELSKYPDDMATRSMVYSSGVSMCDFYAEVYEQLDTMKHDLGSEIFIAVDQVNALTQQIAELNETLSDQPSLELMDLREKCIDELSMLIPIETVYQNDGTIDIITSGSVLVNGCNAQTLEATAKPPEGLPELTFESGATASFESGEIAAMMTMISPEAEGSIQALQADLNLAWTTIVEGVNDVHETGIGLDGSTSVPFFVPINESLPLTIENTMVNPLLEDGNKIGASSSGEAGDGTSALEIVNLQESLTIAYEEGTYGINDYLNAYLSFVGQLANQANFETEQLTEMHEQYLNQLNAVIGVSADDEMASMLVYQQMYNANVNVMNTIDELMEDLLRKLG